MAVPASRLLRLRRGWWEPGSTCRDPDVTYADVRAIVDDAMPAATYERLLLFRYLLIWTKPS